MRIGVYTSGPIGISTSGIADSLNQSLHSDIHIGAVSTVPTLLQCTTTAWRNIMAQTLNWHKMEVKILSNRTIVLYRPHSLNK